MCQERGVGNGSIKLELCTSETSWNRVKLHHNFSSVSSLLVGDEKGRREEGLNKGEGVGVG